jgi:hypothetical protein
MPDEPPDPALLHVLPAWAEIGQDPRKVVNAADPNTLLSNRGENVDPLDGRHRRLVCQ